jgi:hypothetical protein
MKTASRGSGPCFNILARLRQQRKQKDIPFLQAGRRLKRKIKTTKPPSHHPSVDMRWAHIKDSTPALMKTLSPPHFRQSADVLLAHAKTSSFTAAHVKTLDSLLVLQRLSFSAHVKTLRSPPDPQTPNLPAPERFSAQVRVLSSPIHSHARVFWAHANVSTYFSGHHQGFEISGPPQSLDEAFTSHESPGLSGSHQQRGISTPRWGPTLFPKGFPEISAAFQDPSIVSDARDEITAPRRSPNVLPSSDQHLHEIFAPRQDIPSNLTNIAEETSRYPPVPHKITSEPWNHPRLTAAQMAKLPPRYQQYIEDGLIVDGSWSQTGLSADLPKTIPCGFGRAFHGTCRAAFKSYTAAAAHFPEKLGRDSTRTKWIPRCPCIIGKITSLKTTISPTYCLFAKEGFDCTLQQSDTYRIEALKADTNLHELLEHGVPCGICGRLFAGPYDAAYHFTTDAQKAHARDAAHSTCCD